MAARSGLCCCCAGALIRDESSVRGDLPSTETTARWAYSTRFVYGWGDTGRPQQATAGWLAALPVFEPHWQAGPDRATVLTCAGGDATQRLVFPSLLSSGLLAGRHADERAAEHSVLPVLPVWAACSTLPAGGLSPLTAPVPSRAVHCR